jgi:hypothetical protein
MILLEQNLVIIQQASEEQWIDWNFTWPFLMKTCIHHEQNSCTTVQRSRSRSRSRSKVQSLFNYQSRRREIVWLSFSESKKTCYTPSMINCGSWKWFCHSKISQYRSINCFPRPSFSSPRETRVLGWHTLYIYMHNEIDQLGDARDSDAARRRWIRTVV